MSSSFLYRKLAQTYSAGPVESQFGAADEERIYDIPSLHSWFTADPAYFDGTSTYKDKGPRGNNWVQATVAQQPSAVANWRSTGWPALSFNGTSSRIPANFNAPVGPMTFVAVLDVLINDTTQIVIGSNIGSDTSAQYYGGVSHAAPYAFCRFSGAGPTGTGTVGQTSPISLMVWNFDPINGTIDAQLTGGTWATITGVQANINYDTTMQLGSYRMPTENMYTGNLAEALIFTGAMKGTSDLTTVVNALRAKYGI